MDRNALAELLEALDSRQEVEERRREERYTALIETVGLAITTANPTGPPAMMAPKARELKMTVEDDPEAYQAMSDTNAVNYIRNFTNERRPFSPSCLFGC